MEGHVPGDFFNDIINLTTNEQGSTLKTKLEISIKDLYIKYSKPIIDTVIALEAEEVLRLKNEGLVGDFLKKSPFRCMVQF
jgi:hypothetical protein